ncbi:MAG: alpha/beta hydrolase [Gemmatimonadales bacterium]|nr:MAG: alpha/beta hydrolase [Gemmatimonadales bacterium]
MIVVAIPNTGDRTRDLTPASETEHAGTGFPTAGGADRFLGFLADELIPHIDSTYRTETFRVLVGHSIGGLFATHALLTRPDLFRGYVAISPILWWNRKSLVDEPRVHSFPEYLRRSRGHLRRRECVRQRSIRHSGDERRGDRIPETGHPRRAFDRGLARLRKSYPDIRIVDQQSGLWILCSG